MYLLYWNSLHFLLLCEGYDPCARLCIRINIFLKMRLLLHVNNTQFTLNVLHIELAWTGQVMIWWYDNTPLRQAAWDNWIWLTRHVVLPFNFNHQHHNHHHLCCKLLELASIRCFFWILPSSLYYTMISLKYAKSKALHEKIIAQGVRIFKMI